MFSKGDFLIVILESNAENIYAVIWTTTPWSLIANQAVAANEKLKYLFVKSTSSKDVYIIAESLLKNIESIPLLSNNQSEVIGHCLGNINTFFFS